MPWEKWLDTSLYPDEEPPADMDSLPARVDFLARLCAAWDFGVLPDPKTVAEVRQPHWREAVDACRLLTSPAYHLLRALAWSAASPLPGATTGLHPG
jgi:hypothetical protein